MAFASGFKWCWRWRMRSKARLSSITQSAKQFQGQENPHLEDQASKSLLEDQASAKDQNQGNTEPWSCIGNQEAAQMLFVSTLLLPNH